MTRFYYFETQVISKDWTSLEEKDEQEVRSVLLPKMSMSIQFLGIFIATKLYRYLKRLVKPNNDEDSDQNNRIDENGHNNTSKSSILKFIVENPFIIGAIFFMIAKNFEERIASFFEGVTRKVIAKFLGRFIFGFMIGTFPDKY